MLKLLIFRTSDVDALKHYCCRMLNSFRFETFDIGRFFVFSVLNIKIFVFSKPDTNILREAVVSFVYQWILP